VRTAILAITLAALVGCKGSPNQLVINRLSKDVPQLTVSSSAFEDGHGIPRRYTARGENISPPISWSEGPAGTRSYLLIVQDPDAPAPKPLVHWLVYDIHPAVMRLPDGAGNNSSDPRFKQGATYTGGHRYAGPNPDPGPAHHYHFQVFAMDEMLNTEPKGELAKMLKSHVLAKGELVGSYRLGD